MIRSRLHMVPAVFVASILLGAAGAARSAAPDYAPGQVWSFQGTAAAAPGATLTVLAVDKGVMTADVVHIAVNGVKLPQGGSSINHLALTRTGLDRSVVSLVRKERGPFDMSGYENWKKNRGGAFDGTLGALLQLIAGPAPAQKSH